MTTANQKKLNMWKKKLATLEKEYAEIMNKRGEAAQMGDLTENAAFLMFSEEADTYRARIEGVKKFIADLENDKKGK